MNFSIIFKQYYPKVFRLCMGYINDSDWAKDLSQEVFMIVLEKQETLRNTEFIGTWIYRITTNLCLRQLEKSKKTTILNFDIPVDEIILPNIELQTAFLYQSISELVETDRIIISLELEDIPQAEIAKIVGLSESNIRVKIHRIKEKLTQKFKNYHE